MDIKRIRKFAAGVFVVVSLVVCVAQTGTVQGQSPVAASSVSNGRIAFVSDRDGNPEIYVMNAEGTEQMRLTNNIGVWDDPPDWSPGGEKIAFTVWNQAGSNDLEIYVMSADGSGLTNITNYGSTDHTADWSPDGGKIAFARNGDVYVMSADGSGLERLTYSSWQNDSPDWSPDGGKITFRSSRDGNLEIYVMNVDGSSQTRLTYTSEWWEGSPAWSPDGSRIAFDSNRDDGLPRIYVMNEDGSGQRALTSCTLCEEYGPSWSPDGNMITFDSNRDGNYEVYIMDSEGSGVVRLTNDLARDTGPSWGQGEVGPTPAATSSPTPSQTPTQTPVPTATPSADDVHLKVLPIRQNEGPWANDIYNLYGSDRIADTIAKWGCATTSAAMVLGYYGVNTTPKELDDWLATASPLGYVPKEHLIIWSRVRAFAEERGLALKEPVYTSASRANIDSALAAKVPPIVSVCWQNCGTDNASWHWVVVTGRSGSEYFINDPSSWSVLNRQKLSDYPVWGNMVRFERADSSTTSPSLWLYLCSPAELLVTDGQGRRTGIDPTTGSEFSEIPGAFYGGEYLSPADDSGGETMHTKTLVLPEGGTYSVEVIGTGDGSYTLLAISSGSNGQPLSRSITRSVVPGQVDDYVLEYSPADGVMDLLQQTYLPLVMH